MERDAVQKQMKALKSKAKAARKAGKKDMAAAFKNGASHLARKLRAMKAPKAAAEAAS